LKGIEKKQAGLKKRKTTTSSTQTNQPLKNKKHQRTLSKQTPKEYQTKANSTPNNTNLTVQKNYTKNLKLSRPFSRNPKTNFRTHQKRRKQFQINSKTIRNKRYKSIKQTLNPKQR